MLELALRTGDCPWTRNARGNSPRMVVRHEFGSFWEQSPAVSFRVSDTGTLAKESERVGVHAHCAAFPSNCYWLAISWIIPESHFWGATKDSCRFRKLLVLLLRLGLSDSIIDRLLTVSHMGQDIVSKEPMFICSEIGRELPFATSPRRFLLSSDKQKCSVACS